MKTIKYVPRFATGPRVENLMHADLRPSPDVTSFIRKYIAQGESGVKR
jgi:hypothetical protein